MLSQFPSLLALSRFFLHELDARLGLSSFTFRKASYHGMFDGRASQNFDQIGLDVKMLNNLNNLTFDGNVTHSTPVDDDFEFSSIFTTNLLVEFILGASKDLSEFAIVFCKSDSKS